MFIIKKITVTFFIFFFSFSVAFAGPFGLSKGMSVEQISKLSEKCFEPERVSNDMYFFIPKNKIELFKACIAYVDEKKEFKADIVFQIPQKYKKQIFLKL